ncbi:ABC transporter permease [Catellatospora vulcania]|uniref:ABC transporter permease n=1 Tax=Catellatospora vulcania TaxID=1460450 RepID=UPI0012D400BB|nr:ABC transporter permease [Catellatospora vulcania]
MTGPDLPPRQPRRAAALFAHLGWEAILFVLVAVAAVIVGAQSDGDAFGRGLWMAVATTGLLASGFALSLRTGNPNLAVGALGMLAGVVYAKLAQENWPGLLAGATAVVIVVLFCLILGVLTGLTSAPAWAVSLGGLSVAQAVALGLADSRGLPLPDGPAADWAVWVWAAVFVLGTLAGGAVFLSPGVRRALTAARSDGAVPRFQGKRLLGAVLGFAGSGLLAALSGIALAGQLGGAFVVSGDRMLVAVAAVLLGGVSAFTYRGGVAGTLLAVVLLVLVDFALRLADVPSWLAFTLPAGLAIMFGVVVGWVLDKISGPELPA